jgi:hypothetical protein
VNRISPGSIPPTSAIVPSATSTFSAASPASCTRPPAAGGSGRPFSLTSPGSARPSSANVSAPGRRHRNVARVLDLAGVAARSRKMSYAISVSSSARSRASPSVTDGTRPLCPGRLYTRLTGIALPLVAISITAGIAVLGMLWLRWYRWHVKRGIL